MSILAMMKRTATESKEHVGLIRMMANHFASLGYTNIRADIEGYTSPDIIVGTRENHRPDLTCNKNDRAHTLIILEAETCDTISDDHTASQWSLFRDAANNSGGEFHIVVPKFCNGSSGRTSAQQRLRQLGISADEIWTPSR